MRERIQTVAQAVLKLLAVGYSRMQNCLQTMACATCVGPARPTWSRGPHLPRSTGSSPRVAHEISVNDTLRPVSVFFDRVWRLEQLPSVLLDAMRALTDPVNTKR